MSEDSSSSANSKGRRLGGGGGGGAGGGPPSLTEQHLLDTFEDSANNLVEYQSYCTKNKLAFLKSNGWIDQSSRGLYVTICMAPFMTKTTRIKPGSTNDVDVAGCFRILFEISRYQYVSPHYSFYTTRTNTSQEYALAVEQTVQIIFLMLALVLLITEFVELLVKRSRYFFFKDLVWNILDIVVGIICLIIFASYSAAPVLQTDTNVVDPNSITVQAINKQIFVVRAYGCLLFLLSLRMTKVIAISSVFKVPILTLFHSIYKSMPFIAFLMVWGYGGANFTIMWFGPHQEGFHDIYSALNSIGRSFIGDM